MSDAAPTLAGAVGQGAEIRILGQIAWSSNATFLVELTATGPPLQAVYKPEAGERPLADFPPGLWRREVAAYRLARALGWDCIPETVPADGPLGRGSLQRFVEVDYADHYFTLIGAQDPAFDAQLRRLCCFDLVANNTDRKAGHCIVDDRGRIWGIDNALCFHAQFKLRTVIWDFAGERIPADLLEDLARLDDEGLPADFTELLDPFEGDATTTRIRAVRSSGVFPDDPTGRRVPWPLI